jgi:thioesterase domain-containing protein
LSDRSLNKASKLFEIRLVAIAFNFWLRRVTEGGYYLDSNQPLYGCQSVGLDCYQAPHTQVEQMATSYIQELKTIQPHGPYLISGWSLGGLIAFEMAQQLTDQGEQIAFLGLIDVYPSTVYTFPDASTEVKDDQLLVSLFGHDLGLTLIQLQQLEPVSRTSYVTKIAKQKHLVSDDFDLVQSTKVYKLNVQAGRDYKPKYYPGQIVIFQASERHPWIAADIDFESSWDSLVTGIETCLVPGNHENIVTPPRVKILAQYIQTYLDKAQKHQLETSNAQTTEK